MDQLVTCEYCDSSNLKIKSFIGGDIYICQECSLGFNSIEAVFDYENESDFVIDKKMLFEWNLFAQRDANLIINLIQQEKNENINILEIGSGFALASNYIEASLDVDNYYHMEKNKNLISFQIKNGKNTISEFNDITRPQDIDFIVLNHVLEHIIGSHCFLSELMENFPSSTIILLQTNHMGFIPKYLSSLWYGWQLNQHYYHFTPSVFKKMEILGEININDILYYKLSQSLSFSIKGLVKAFLKIVNFFIYDKKMDAFAISFKKRPGNISL
jgi:hypothetical protein